VSFRDADDDRSDRYSGRPGGDWRGVRPSLDNPMSWSVPIGRVAGITIRVHFTLLLFIAIQMLKSSFGAPSQSQEDAPLGLTPNAILMGSLFLIVLLHEFGHCFACRRVGGEADEILMWPLGGLASCQSPNDWRSNLITTIGGPAVNVVIFLILAPVLGVLTGHWFGVALPNPFTVSGLYDASSTTLTMWLFLIHWVNLALLLFNLLPIFPFDGGRILQAILWRNIGYRQATLIAVRAGYIGAIGLAALAFLQYQMILLMVALFGAVTCWTTKRQLDHTDDFLGIADDGAEERAARLRARERQQAEKDGIEMDRILQKIAEGGMSSLTRGEKKFLQRETRKRSASM
jgi:stage IV sporulation protein FB